MNIQAAAVYWNIGYKLRRTSWAPDSYAKASSIDDIEVYSKNEYYTFGNVDGIRQTIKHSYIGSHGSLTVQDMLAEDWELITTGIRKHFNKYGSMEYDDDIDHDNQSLTSSSWDDDE